MAGGLVFSKLEWGGWQGVSIFKVGVGRVAGVLVFSKLEWGG